MAEEYDYSKNVSEYSKNIDERDTRAVESAVQLYGHVVGNPKQALKVDDVFEVIETSTNHAYNQLHIKMRRQDGTVFPCEVNALSEYESNGKWMVSVRAEGELHESKENLAITIMELSEDGTTLKPVKEEDLLALARYVEEEKQNFKSSHNHSYMVEKYEEATKKAFHLNEEGKQKKNETLLEKGVSLFKKL